MSKRSTKEIEEYANEAFDRVWLMRSQPCSDLETETRRQEAIERILSMYPDIPLCDYTEYAYTDWECGYWNGIMSALRWVLGYEKDFLDT